MACKHRLLQMRNLRHSLRIQRTNVLLSGGSQVRYIIFAIHIIFLPIATFTFNVVILSRVPKVIYSTDLGITLPFHLHHRPPASQTPSFSILSMSAPLATVGILSIGEMGMGIAKLLVAHNYRVVTNLEGRRWDEQLSLGGSSPAISMIFCCPQVNDQLSLGRLPSSQLISFSPL